MGRKANGRGVIVESGSRGGELRIAVLGAGKMGRGAAFDLVNSSPVEEVLLADRDQARAEGLARWLKSPKVKPLGVDAQEPEEMIKLLEGCDAAISCLPYRCNLEVVKCAIRA